MSLRDQQRKYTPAQCAQRLVSLHGRGAARYAEIWLPEARNRSEEMFVQKVIREIGALALEAAE